MICAQGVSKSFGGSMALDSVTAEIKTGSIYGLIGSNGAGKSTFLRILAGILRPDSGIVTIDDEEVFENPGIKQQCFMISDEQYFFSGCTPRDMKDYYKSIYPHFDEGRYRTLMRNFGLDERRKIRTFSKGMKKQVSVICAASSGADYLFCDETFDGLDPVARQAVKSIFAGDVAEFSATPVIASHNLRELEDFCDCIGLLHRGGILFSRDLDDMTRKSSSCKLGTLIRKCCGRNAALFTLSLLLQLVAMPVYLIMVIHAQLRYTDLSDAEAREAVRQEIAGMLQEHGMGTIVLVFMAVLAGIAMFRYLHVKKQTDFFHALPVTRGQMFVSRFFTGILLVVPSYLLSVVLSCGVCVVYGFADAIDPSILLLSIVVHLTGFLLVYTVAILAAIVSGHTLVSLLVCAWFQFGLLAGYIMMDELLYTLYPARLIYSRGEIPIWLSPVFEAVAMIQPLGINETERSAYWQECLQPVAFCLIAAGLLLALSYYLNRIRKSENTGLSIAFPKFEQPFKLYMVSVGAIFCSLIFEATMESWTALFISMAIGGLITACIIEIVYDLDFHSLFRRWKSLAVYYVVCAVVLGCMAMDITHWNSTLPERDEIVSATLYSGMGTWNCGPADGNENDYEYYSDRIYAMLSRLEAATSSGYVDSFSEVDDTDSAIDHLDTREMESADALDAMYASASMGAEAMKHNRSTIKNDENSNYVVKFTLQNGKTFTRQYYMPTDTTELADNGATVRFSKEYREKFTEAAIAQANKEQVKQLLVENYVDMEADRSEKIKNTKAIDDILDTLYEETQELTKEYVSENLPVLVIRAVGEQAYDWRWMPLDNLDQTGGAIDDIIDIPIYACQTETLQLLGEYVDNLETGFGSAQIVKVSVENFDEYEESYTEYTDEEHIAKWKPYLIPSCCERIIDDVYMMPEDAYSTYITVELADGTQISCVCWRNIGGIADIVGQPWKAG